MELRAQVDNVPLYSFSSLCSAPLLHPTDLRSAQEVLTHFNWQPVNVSDSLKEMTCLDHEIKHFGIYSIVSLHSSTKQKTLTKKNERNLGDLRKREWERRYVCWKWFFFFTHKPFSYQCMREKITGLRWNWALGAARTQICNFEAKAV